MFDAFSTAAALMADPGVIAVIVMGSAFGFICGLMPGKGHPEGIVASESANHAKDGGSVLPTLAFGIPGSAEMAVFMGALRVLATWTCSVRRTTFDVRRMTCDG